MDMIHLDVKGKVFKITFNPKKKKEISGWLLFITDTEEEYLIRRNISISNKMHEKIYQTDIPLKTYIIEQSTIDARR